MTCRATPVVAGIGEILWDILPEGKQLGGAPANFAFHALALGARAAVVSAVGDDALGHAILERLDRWGIDRTAVSIDIVHPTGTVSVSLGDNGVPQYVIHEGVAWDFIQDSPVAHQLAQSADAVCFGSLCQRSEVSREAVRRLLGSVRADCLRVFDINLRNSGPDGGVIIESLRLANVLKLNDEELPLVAAMTGVCTGPRAALRELASRFDLAAVALTRGPHGSLIYSRGEYDDQPGQPVDVVDTVGAGDAFTAALTLGLLRGETISAIGERANRLAGAVCGGHGGTPDVRAAMQDW
jgi:fructokinase